jgi:hypothetical protein
MFEHNYVHLNYLVHSVVYPILIPHLNHQLLRNYFKLSIMMMLEFERKLYVQLYDIVFFITPFNHFSEIYNLKEVLKYVTSRHVPSPSLDRAARPRYMPSGKKRFMGRPGPRKFGLFGPLLACARSGFTPMLDIYNKFNRVFFIPFRFIQKKNTLIAF